MLQYFDISPFQRFPTSLLLEIFDFLSIHEIPVCSTVCLEWKNTLSLNELWLKYFESKFIRLNPNSVPLRPSIRNLQFNPTFYKDEYYSRLLDPQVGDFVEVAWRGKFRLETQEIYIGLAWWVAEIVDKDGSRADKKYYKIHYPGWESRWDEWVSRSRLRWVASSNDEEELRSGDVVELWCSGHNVPGAWLECFIKRIRNGSYCLGKVISQGGLLWVHDRSRLRLVSRNGVVRTGRGTGRIALQQYLDDPDESHNRLPFRSRSRSNSSPQEVRMPITTVLPIVLHQFCRRGRSWIERFLSSPIRTNYQREHDQEYLSQVLVRSSGLNQNDAGDPPISASIHTDLLPAESTITT
jgi:hypothetical protein